jgi:hypothetical protein
MFSLFPRPADTDWQMWDVFFRGRVTLLDGTVRKSGTVMRRRVNGQWQYRALSDEEELERQQGHAW